MKNNLLVILLLIFQVFLIKADDSQFRLNIYRSKRHEDQTGNLTPLVISLSSDDVKEKKTNADLIFVVDISSSMSGNAIKLVKDTLTYIVEMSNENDNIALVTFSNSAQVKAGLTKMTAANKNSMKSIINALYVSGGTNILSGMQMGLNQITKDYTTGDRVCSLILLSDGEDIYGNKLQHFVNLINNGAKKNYIFTTHAFGYGNYHDSDLMSGISKIRDGGFFFIQEFAQIKTAFIQIYGFLSTVLESSLKLQAQSTFNIKTIYGMEDMYQSSLVNNTKISTFNVNLLQVTGGKTYSFVALVDIPEDTPYGTEVLNATLIGKNIHANYLWDNYYHPAAYEEYIRCIAFTIIADGFANVTINGLVIIQNGIAWLKLNYEGYFNWEGILSETIYDLQSFNSYGKANILAKLRELKSQKIGTHYTEGNTFVDTLIQNEQDLDIVGNDENQIIAEQNINLDNTKNYYYFYLKEGIAKLNGTHFSGEHSSIMIYSDVVDKITLKPLTASFLYYYKSEKKTRIQNWVDMGRGAKFIFKKDFPFDFHTRVDGKYDILFNIQLLNLEYTTTQNEIPSFEILAYVVPESMITTLSGKNYNYKVSSTEFKGYYDKGSRIGKLLIKKEEISRNINYSTNKNYLYIIIQKVSTSQITYKKVEGQFSFIEMNYRSRNIPEGFYIFNNLLPGQKNPHQYTIKMDPTPGKEIRIEFASTGSELNCKVLKYNSYVIGSEELYSDYNEYDIRRETRLGKTYIYVKQNDDKNKLIEEIIVSIFSSNEGNAASSDYAKLEYSLRYTRDSDYGIYDIKDLNEKYCDFTLTPNAANPEKIKIDFYPIKSKNSDDQSYVKEKTRFYLKAYTFDKKKEFIKGTVALFEKNQPNILKEINMNNEDKLSMEFDTNRINNYFLALFTISQRTGEIIGYQAKKLYKIAKDIIITDFNSYENEYNNDLELDFKVASDVKKSHLLIQITDLDDGESLTIKASIGNIEYTGQNKVLIPKATCKGKDIKLEISLNYGDENEYYLNIYMIDKFVIDTGIKNSMTYTIEHLLHEDSEYPKVCNLYDDNLYAASSVVNMQSTKVSKLNKEGKPIYGNATVSIGYSPSADLIQPYNLDYYILTYHNKQELQGKIPKENILTLKDHNTVIRSIGRKDYIYQQTSSVPLKDGNVLIAGIKHISTFGEKTAAEINIYNPKTGIIGNGISINAYSKYISCYEQTKNYVYCVYVSLENQFIHKLKLKEIFVNGNTLEEKRERVIKSFFTEFNYLKAIRYNEKEGIILFQTGTNKKPEKCGDSGKDLFYYHIKIVDDKDLVQIKRYEYLYDNCLYDEDKKNPEYYNADIAVLSYHKVFAVCETAQNKFKGFIIYQNKEQIDEFYFNNFGANDVKTPVFAKFGKSLGIFYTSINENLRKNTKYHIMNYPDCFNYITPYILIPQGFKKELDFMGKVFLSNPYPAGIKEDIKVRFRPYIDVNITEALYNTTILPDTDYQAALTLIIIPNGKTGKYYLEYTATKEDPMDGIILGNTCSMPLFTPECLEQCLSCTQMGNEEHHMCLGCKKGPYYYEQDPDAKNDGYGFPHFCKRCDISCASCRGGFLDYVPTTNCIKCDYKNNYFHYEFDERTCISNETKEYWENVTGYALYLDKSEGEGKEEKWRWRHCHKNCASCLEGGDDDNNKCYTCKPSYYFFCNQTLENGGIPGSCNSECKDNGFFVTVKEDREKCCPCSSHCKVCTNETECNKCYPEFFRTKNEYDNETVCDPECGYCLAEDRNRWECVNCKYDYPEPRYTLNKTCVKEIPYIEFLKRYHHIIDDTCNLLIGCKEGCHKCAPWYSDECTECNVSYYKEDGKLDNETFHCYEKDTCIGNKSYIHDITKQIGGVPMTVNGEKVCWNCKLHGGKYRLPDEIVCGEKIDRTYIDIDEYNKLSYCYFRCKECDYWGNSMVMNCSLCREPKYYEPRIKIGDYYNCYRKEHKCGVFPYYHDYDLGEEKGLEDCGEECDICMTNFTCPRDLPFYVFATRECVEYCPLVDVMGGECDFYDKRAGVVLIDTPFGTRHGYDPLNTTLYLNNITSLKYFEYIKKTFNVEITQSITQIGNLIGNGQIYNLPENKIYIGNNITIELSSVQIEQRKLQKIANGQMSQANASIIDLAECEKLLKQEFNLKVDEDLLIIKGDFLEELSKVYLSSKIEYQLFSTSMGAFLPLGKCKDAGIPIYIKSPMNSSYLFQAKTKSIIDNDLNPYDPTSNFYNDICTPFTNEYGTDVLLYLRRTEYFNKDNNLCEEGCTFEGYNETIKMFTCKCEIKQSINDQSNYEVKPMIIPEDFFEKKEEYSNIKVFKCAKQVFSLKGQKYNFGSYILLACFFCFIGGVVFYFLKGKKQMENDFENLNKSVKKSKNINVNDNNINNNPANPPKNDDEKKTGKNTNDDEVNKEKIQYDILLKQQEQNPANVVKDFVINEEDLNSIDYDTAIKIDKRNYWKYYWSLLKMKQLCIFTFFTHTDHNSRSVKIILFTLFISFYFAFTALFFNDDIMRDIYIYKGSPLAAIHVTNIILSSFCCLVMNLIIRFVSLSERNIHKALNEKNPDDRRSKIEEIRRQLSIKLIIVFITSGLLIGLCWYYVAAFCAVFKNSQGHYFANVLCAFIICNLWPCVTSLIAPWFRIKSIKDKNSKCMYKLSQIIAYF